MLIKILILILSVLNSTFVLAQNFERIIKKSSLSQSDLGICVVNHDKVLFETNRDKQMTPASLSKILTAVGVLKTLSPEDKFESKLLITDLPQNGVLKGPIYVQTGADPSFISETLWVLVNHFVREGVTQIKGPIIVDHSLFDEKLYDESRQSVRVDRAYDAPVSAASFNWNSVNVYVRPGLKGDSAKVYLDPESDYFVLSNQMKTVSGRDVDIQISLDKVGSKEKVTVHGKIGAQSPEAVKFASIQNPVQWLGANLISFLKQRGISVENTVVQTGVPPSQARVVAKTQGWSLFELVDGMMKYSNNFIAEMLVKQLAARAGTKRASIDDGLREIKATLKKEYKIESYQLLNPSGFTNKNKISACDLSLLLDRAQKDFSVGPALISSMPRPGGEGTLKRRMKGGEHLIRAKTGLLSGVIGLAGYASNGKGEVFSFAFMYNGTESGEERARNLFDQLALEVTKL